MRSLLWVALLFLAAFWSFSLEIYGINPSLSLALFSLILGIALCIAGSQRIEASSEGRFAALSFLFVFGGIVIPFPYNTGLIVIAIALVLTLLGGRWSALWVGTLIGGIVLTLQSFAIYMYYILAPSFHYVAVLSPLLSFLSHLISPDVSSNAGYFFVSAQGEVFPFSVTLEKMGFYPWILLFLGAIFFAALTASDRKKFGIFVSGLLLISFAYLLIRFLILVWIFLARDLPLYAPERLVIFTDPYWTMLSFLPLIILLFALFPVPEFRINLSLDISRKDAVSLIAFSLGFIMLISSITYQDPGIKKDGKVLVDEIHSIWEYSTLKMDTDWYGESSTYNAYSMVEWLNDSYKVDRVVNSAFKNLTVPGVKKVKSDVVAESLTPELLNNYDILIIKTPNRYNPEEVEAIFNFVEKGGGLFLIGDHTNFDGTSTNLNQIANRFGINFEFDSVNTMDGRLYYHERGLFDHPSVKYMPQLDFMTGCSLSAPLIAEPVILGFDLRAEPGEYASSGFFRETRKQDPTRATDTVGGLLYQAVAVKQGRGRVIAFSDSTIISNFRIFYGGSANFVIGAMEYLNYRNSIQNLKLLLMLFGIIIVLTAIHFVIKSPFGKRNRMAVFLLILGIAVVLTGSAMISSSTQWADSIPSKYFDQNKTVVFDGQYSAAIVDNGLQRGDYRTFFVWVQRLDLTPTVENNIRDALNKGKAVVMVNPTQEISLEDRNSIREFVKEGNSFFLMLNSTQFGSNLSADFGLKIYNSPYSKNMSSFKRRSSLNETVSLPLETWGLAIKGGNPLLTIGNRTVLAEKDYGTGKFVVFSDSNVFKDGLHGKPGYMGYRMTHPDSMNNSNYNLRDLYNLEYAIFDYLMGRKEDFSRT